MAEASVNQVDGDISQDHPQDERITQKQYAGEGISPQGFEGTFHHLIITGIGRARILWVILGGEGKHFQTVQGIANE